MVIRSGDVAIHVGHARVLRERPQHLRNRAGEIRVRKTDAGYNRLRRREARRCRLLREQIAEHQVPRVQLLGIESPAAAAEEVAAAARIRRTGRHRRCQRVLQPGVPVLIARWPAADVGIAVRDAAAQRPTRHEACVERRIEERRLRVRGHAVGPVVSWRESVTARERDVRREAERAGAVPGAGASAHRAAPRVHDAVAAAQHGSFVEAVGGPDAGPDVAVVGRNRRPAMATVLAVAGELNGPGVPANRRVR